MKNQSQMTKNGSRQPSAAAPRFALVIGLLLTALNLSVMFQGASLDQLAYFSLMSDLSQPQRQAPVSSEGQSDSVLVEASNELKQAAKALSSAALQMVSNSKNLQSVVRTGEYSQVGESANAAANGVSERVLMPTLSEWKNDNDIVHVFTTRFMLHQPNLVTLGTARMKLFEAFCLPTIRGQTNQQFLWIIRADPELHPKLRRQLLNAVQGMDNVAIVGSNELRKGSRDGGFRAEHSISDITEESLWYGNLNLVRSYHRALSTRTLMEVTIDADDGLELDFVDRTERETKKIVKTGKEWFNWCAGDAIEWQYLSGWDPNTTRGSLRPASTHICLTPGLTWVTGPSSNATFVGSHHRIKALTSVCSESALENCWMHIPLGNDPRSVKKELYTAIRARSPTSTGMNTVVTKSGNRRSSEIAMDAYLWTRLGTFGITESSIAEARKYISQNIRSIAAENLKGQCQQDHSCSDGIDQKIRQFLDQQPE